MIAEKMAFEGKKIVIDGGSFYTCQFKSCTLIYNGMMPVTMDGCSFDDCNWEFGGSALNTLVFMKALYKSGAKDMIENAFRNIRGEKVERGPALR